MRWRLRLSEFDFGVEYKKGRLNTQTDALLRLETIGETISALDEEIPCFLTDRRITGSEEPDFVGSIDELEYDELDQILAVGTPTGVTIFQPIGREEMLRELLNDQFCRNIRAKLEWKEKIAFRTGTSGLL